ncbi:MAG: phosphate acetyltransferase [Planctomycetota bacterium]
MAESVYIATSEPGSGKGLVTLGVMDSLVRHAGRPAFFRPVVKYGPDSDDPIVLMRDRYGLPDDPAEMFGLTREAVRGLLAADRYEDLIKTMIERYKALEEKADFVLVDGTSYQGLATAQEFDLNADLAANFGCAVLPVMTARGKRLEDVASSLLITLDGFRDANCEIAAAIVNHADESLLPFLRPKVAASAFADVPLFAIPADPLLDKPTVGEIAAATDAKLLFGDPAGLSREVRRYAVAAMQVPHFTERISEGALVITPGDREDILLASLLSVLSTNVPDIAAVILTGGMEPSPAVRRLVEGVSPVPVLSVFGDTFNTAVAVNGVESVIRPEDGRKIAGALGLFEKHVDTAELERRVTSSRVVKTTPAVFEYGLIRRARQTRRRIVLPEGAEPRILAATEILRRRDVVDVTLLGNEDEVRRAAATAGTSLDGVELIDPETSPLTADYAVRYHEARKHKGMTREAARDRITDVSYFGTMMVHAGRADGMVSGAVHTTGHTIRPALEFVKTKPGFGIVSSVFFMCLADRVLVYGDCAVNPNPDADQLAEIALSSADTAAAFGIEPRVAMLSYSTGASGQGEDVDKIRAAAAKAKQLRPDLRLEGPIQYDAAVDPDVAKTKLPDSDVAGRATVFVFPDLNTGNNTYKAVQRSSGAVAIGPVLQGLNKPVNDLSRGCTVDDIVNTVAITAVQAGL